MRWVGQCAFHSNGSRHRPVLSLCEHKTWCTLEFYACKACNKDTMLRISKRHLTFAATTTSSSIGAATLVGFGLLNYRWVFSAGRFLQSAVASSMSNPQPGGPVIRTFQLPPPGVPHAWNNASESQQRKGEKWPRILPKVVPSSLLGSFTCCKFTTRDQWLYFSSKGRRAEDFFAWKIWRLRPGLNPRTRVPEASTLTSRPTKPLHCCCYYYYYY